MIELASQQRVQPQGDAELRLLDIVGSLTSEAHAQGRAPVTLDSRLEQDLGLDSLSRMELLLRIERAFGVALPEQTLVSAETPRDLLSFIDRGTPPAAIVGGERRSLTQGPSSSPLQAQTLIEVLDWHVSVHPNKLHIYLHGDRDSAEEITYSDLREGARVVAAEGRAVLPAGPAATVAPGRGTALSPRGYGDDPGSIPRGARAPRSARNPWGRQSLDARHA